MPRPTSPHARRHLIASLALAALLALAGCSSSASTSGGPTATTAHPTATPLPPQTLAWVQDDSSGNPQVWATIAGAAPRQISHNDGSVVCGEVAFGPPVFSPDATHVAVVGGVGCGDGQSHGPVFVVDVATGALTQVPDADSLTDTRSLTWLDNTTLLINGAATYTLGAASATNLPGSPGGIEAVVRGSTLFYLASGGTPGSALTAAIHRYSLTSHSDLGSPISLGGFDLPTDSSPGDFHFQGWDVSPDGSHVAYQVTTAAAVTDSNPAGIGGSRVYYANADGSGASQILQYMTTNSMIDLRFSPDGSQVAVTGAEPAPDIISGCVASPGTRSDPCFHSYSLPAGYASFAYPVWSSDGHTFIVAVAGPSVTALYRFTVGSASGSVFQPSAQNPWAN